MAVSIIRGFRSPNDAERLGERAIPPAWLHHKGRNKHHFRLLDSITASDKPGHPIEGVRMPRRYVAEMLMDRIAASKVYNGENYTDHDPLEYFLKGKAHYMLHPKTEREIEGLLRMLDQRGEEYLYGYVKTCLSGPAPSGFSGNCFRRKNENRHKNTPVPEVTDRSRPVFSRGIILFRINQTVRGDRGRGPDPGSVWPGSLPCQGSYPGSCRSLSAEAPGTSPLVVADELEHFDHQGQDLFRRVVSGEKKIETGAAAHGAEVEDAGFPGLMVP